MSSPPLDLLREARHGTLTQRRINDFQQSGGDINAPASNGLTLLAAASLGASEGAIRTLIKFSADVNKSSAHNCTPLWFATRILDKHKAHKIINQLLGAGAEVKIISDETMMGSTPLMNALRANQGLKVLSLLLAKQAKADWGPGKTTKREHADATAVATFLGNTLYETRLKNGADTEDVKQSRSSFVTAINQVIGFMVGVVNKFTGGALDSKLGVKTKPQYENVYDGQQKFDPVAFQKDLHDQIAASGIDKFFPADSKLLDKIVAKANAFAKRGTSALAAPEYLPGLSHLSLYQPIIFCDNSGSMNIGNRIDGMIDVVTRIAEIATHLVPDEEGVEVRFLNTHDKERALYAKYGKIRTPQDATSMLSGADYSGPTELGTILEREVLQPYIYDIIDNGKKFERPLLISIITDGVPYDDDDHTLTKVVVRCKQKLKEKGFDPRIVTFQISQIGDDDEADGFLRELQTDPVIKDLIFVTAGKLDEEFNKINDNEDELEIFLYNTLMGPILRA